MRIWTFKNTKKLDQRIRQNQHNINNKSYKTPDYSMWKNSIINLAKK